MQSKDNHSDWDAKHLGGSIKRGIVNPDLLEERAKSSFNKAELEVFVYGPDAVEQIAMVADFNRRHPELVDGFEYYEMSREEKFKSWWRKYHAVMKDEKAHIFFTNNSQRKDHRFQWAWAYPGLSLLALHQTMFTSSIKFLGSEKQQAKYLPLCDNLSIIGNYAQTELGHGSNVAGLETTATLDQATDEFVIHTPTIKATKFWPGSLGVVGTHSIVFARCIAGGNDYGVQPFLVQIRSTEDHKPLKGVSVGDIGEKLGYNSVDNGYLSFDHLRISRSNMLSRFVKITKTGDMEMKAHPKLLYMIMVMTRLHIIFGGVVNIFTACLRATRYAICRRQFANIKGSTEERKLIDYQTHM